MAIAENISTKVTVYYEAMRDSDSERLKSVFSDHAMITGYMDGSLVDMSIEQFADFVSSRNPSDKEKGAEELLEIISCDISGDTAVVKVRDSFIGRVFVDTLSFLKVEGEWKIFNKLFHIETEK